MSREYEGQDKMDIAAQAERDLNSPSAKLGVEEGTGFGGKDQYRGASDSAREGGIDESVTDKFPGSTAEYSQGRTIPEEQGGGIQRGTGKTTKMEDFDQGAPGEGPDDVERQRARDYGGEDDVNDRLRGVNAETNNSGIDEQRA